MGPVDNLHVVQNKLKEKCSVTAERPVNDWHFLSLGYSHLMGELVKEAREQNERLVGSTGV